MRVRLRFACVAALPLLAVLASCGSGGSPVVSGSGGSFAPTATASRTPTGDVLFAVLESKAHNGRADTVAIVGLDGIARAKARFTPVAVPQIGNAAPVIPDVAHVAAGSVFYVDREGTVRALSPGDTQPEQVTRFPAGGSQQEVGFAVDPTGRHLIAAVLTLPPLLPPSPANCDICRGFGDQSGTVDVEIADRGGSEHTVRTIELSGDQLAQRLDVVAWDSQGPVGALDRVIGAQYAVPGWDAHIAHLDARGNPGPRLAGGCRVNSQASNGTVICNVVDGAEVRDAAGRRLMTLPRTDAVLSADGTRVAYMDSSGALRAGPVGGAMVQLPDLDAQGFVGDDIVVGSRDVAGFNEELWYVRLSDPTHLVDLGFTGEFAGSIAA